MSLLPFCEWLATTQGSIALRESFTIYPLIESVHVLTLCVFVGMAVILDLRLLGVTLRNVEVTQIVDRVMPLMIAGFGVMMLSGVLLFYAHPVRTYQSVFFRLKLIFLLVAGLNAWRFTVSTYRSVDAWNTGSVTSRPARLAGALSLFLWAGIVITGRMIAYNWFDCDHPQPPIIVWAAGCTSESP